VDNPRICLYLEHSTSNISIPYIPYTSTLPKYSVPHSSLALGSALGAIAVFQRGGGFCVEEVGKVVRVVGATGMGAKGGVLCNFGLGGEGRGGRERGQ